MHVDMDCFFAAVSSRSRPELQDVPLAVAHSNHAAGHSEVSCVNYTARGCGVRAGCWVADAKRRFALDMSTHDACWLPVTIATSRPEQMRRAWLCCPCNAHELCGLPVCCSWALTSNKQF